MPLRARWLLLWIALAALLVGRAASRPAHRGVLNDHLEFGRRLLHGENVYADWKSDLDAPTKPLHAPYPPSFGLMTAPFSAVHELLGLRAARVAWALMQVFAIAWLLSAIWRMPLPPPSLTLRERQWLSLAALALLARLILRDTHGGGGNLVNVALCAAAFLDAQSGRPRRAGWLLGFSIATKPTQALLLPLLWLQGKRSAALHTVLCGLACVVLSIALLRFDLSPWLRWLEGTLALAGQTDAFAVPALQFPEFEWMNQSLRCATARWIGDVPSEFAARVAWGVSPGLGLSAQTAAWCARAIVLAMLSALLVAAWRSARNPDGTAAARAHTRQFAAALALSLLASPLSWKAHHVALLPLFCLLLRSAHRTKSKPMWALLLLWFLTCGIGKEILGDDGDEWLNSIYVVTMFDIPLFFAVLRAPRDEPQS